MLIIGPVSGIGLIWNHPSLLQNGWLQAFTNLSLKQPQNVSFQKCENSEWFVDVPNQVS